METLISVIVPIYRVERYLDKCIQSIMNQTYKNLEIILVDDGSDDNSGEICDKYVLLDERIKVIHKKNGGQDSARKAGMRIAQGEYIGYVDGDDWLEPEMYEVLLADAQNYNADVVESGIIDNYEEEEKIRCPYLPEGIYRGEDFEKKVIPVFMYTGHFFQAGITPYLVTKLFRKSIVERYQLWDDEIQIVLDDNIVTYSAIANASSLYIEHKCFYHYKLNNSSTKHSVNRQRDRYLMYTVEGYKKRIQIKNESIIRQIEYNSMYHLLSRLPQVFDDMESEICLIPYGGIPKQSKVILYGAGSVGIHMWHYLKTIKELQIVYWVDRNYKNIEDSYPVKNPREIVGQEYDYIIISVMRDSAVESICNDLNELGAEQQRIKWLEKTFLVNPDKLLRKADFENINLT